jgi:cell division protein FtsB
MESSADNVIIDELKAAHEVHIQKLTQLHSNSSTDLHHQLLKTRQQLEIVSKERDEYKNEIEAMRTEVEMLRGSFDLVQERLRRVLVDQDDLVKMVKLIEKEFDNKNGEEKVTKKFNNNNNNKNNNSNSNSNSNSNNITTINEIETNLKRKEQDSATITALTAIKYFKKLEASDPIHLCRLLEIPFYPERSFSLSTSLLASISVHMTTDTNAMKWFNEHPVYAVLLNEILNLKQDTNELCKLFLATSNSKMNRKEIIAAVSKFIDEKEKKENNKSILKLLIEETKLGSSDEEVNRVQSIFSTVLSKFGI